MRKPRIFAANRYPLRDGNNIELLRDGAEFYPRMISAIHQAHQSIFLEQYLVNSGKVFDLFFEAMKSAVARGVSVIMLLDDYGSRGLSANDRAKVYAAGIRMHFYNPIKLQRIIRNLFRNHRKLLLIDALRAFVGGAGISDEFLIPQKQFQNTPWRDVVLEIGGPVVADWADLFRHTAKFTTALQDTINWDALIKQRHESRAGQKAQVLVASAWGRQEISQAFLKRARCADQRLWLSTPYFVSTKKIRRALCLAARRGVDTRLLVPGPYSDHTWISYASQRFFPKLLDAGVKIYEYQPGFSHSKIQLIDNWVSIGSCNLDRWNMHWNLDANQSVADKDFAERVAVLLAEDFLQCSRVTVVKWSRRSLLKRIKSLSSSLIVTILEKLLSRF